MQLAPAPFPAVPEVPQSERIRVSLTLSPMNHAAKVGRGRRTRRLLLRRACSPQRCRPAAGPAASQSSVRYRALFAIHLYA